MKYQPQDAGVVSGLSKSEGFHDQSNKSLDLDRASGKKNQVPVRKKGTITTDRGSFTRG